MNTLRILDKTKQQRLDYLQSKIYLLQQLKMTEDEYSKRLMATGELFVTTIWDRDAELQMRILTDERLGFWSAFKYEWFKHDIAIVHLFFKGMPLNRIVYRNFKTNYFGGRVDAIKNILYKVDNNLKKYECDIK